MDPILRDTGSLQVAGYMIHILCIYIYAVRIRSKSQKLSHNNSEVTHYSSQKLGSALGSY